MPTIFERVSKIIEANLNDMLDGAEDPEVMLNQIIRDMAEGLKDADSSIADQIAQLKMIEGDLDQAEDNRDNWDAKAKLAVAKKRDDLAREALTRFNDYVSQVETYSKQREAQADAVAKLKSKRDQLKAKYDGILRKKDVLISAQKRAEAVSAINHQIATASEKDYGSELARLERRVKTAEARAEAEAEVEADKTTVEDEFAALEQESELDQQLAALKAKMGQPVAAS